MEQTSKLTLRLGALLVFVLTVGVFGIINTEMGVIGILPLIAETFHVTVPEAPDFANGLFLLSAHLGTTTGAAVCGLFITCFNTRYSVFGSLLFLVLGVVFVALGVRARESRKQLKLEIVSQWQKL